MKKRKEEKKEKASKLKRQGEVKGRIIRESWGVGGGSVKRNRKENK